MAKIFLVDDDEITAQIASEAFFDAGHTFGWLEDGQEALDTIRCRQPDAVICNYSGRSVATTIIIMVIY